MAALGGFEGAGRSDCKREADDEDCCGTGGGAGAARGLLYPYAEPSFEFSRDMSAELGCGDGDVPDEENWCAGPALRILLQTSSSGLSESRFRK